MLGLLQTLAEKVHVFFHLLHLGFLRDAGGANRLVEFRDVTQNLAPSREPRFASLQSVADLGKNPRIPDRAASNHQPGSAGFFEGFHRARGRADIAIRLHGKRQSAHGLRDPIQMNPWAVFFCHRSSMDCEQVEPVSGENLQQGVKLRRTLKPDARLDRKRTPHRAAQNAEEFVHPGQVPEEPTASTFAINNRRGTAEVEIDRRDGVLFQSLRHAGHRHEVVADDLRYRWPAGGIFHNRAQDRFLRHIVGRNPKKFGEIQIRTAMAGHQPPERPVCDVLHRRERKNRPPALEQLRECLAPAVQIFDLIHRITPPSTGKCS